jgi:hypothetical protein
MSNSHGGQVVSYAENRGLIMNQTEPVGSPLHDEFPHELMYLSHAARRYPLQVL